MPIRYRYYVIVIVALIILAILPMYRLYYSTQYARSETIKINAISSAIRNNPEYLEYLRAGGK